MFVSVILASKSKPNQTTNMKITQKMIRDFLTRNGEVQKVTFKRNGEIHKTCRRGRTTVESRPWDQLEFEVREYDENRNAFVEIQS